MSPLKEPVFNALHTFVHYTETTNFDYHNTFQLKTYHDHDAFGNHKMTNDAPPLANHMHTATGKVVTNHSHKFIAFLNNIFTSPEDQKKHQKSALNFDLDKHLLISEHNLNSTVYLNYHHQKWNYIFALYSCNLPKTTPPPKFVS